jgi:hypothetical protein
MVIFARREHPLDVPVQRLHNANPRHHRWAAVAFGDQDQDFNGSLPFLDLLFSLRELLDKSCGFLDVTSWRPRGSGIGSSNLRFQPRSLITKMSSANV